jgi:hypothetical protein
VVVYANERHLAGKVQREWPADVPVQVYAVYTHKRDDGALGGPAVASHPQPRVINADEAKCYALSIQESQELLWLACVEEFDHIEIALVPQLREQSIRALLFRARKKFASFLTEQGFVSEEGSLKRAICRQEAAVSRAARTDQGEGSLWTHVAGCGVCRDIVVTARWVFP